MEAASIAATGPTLTVDNPYYGPTTPDEHRKVTAPRALRDDPLGQMHDRGQVDAAQYAAAREWQRQYEAAGAPMPSSGDLQEPVDAGGNHKPGITDRQINAGRSLARLGAKLGPRGNQIVHLVLADKMTLREVANRLYFSTERHTMIYLGARWRECLDTLAVETGFAAKPLALLRIKG